MRFLLLKWPQTFFEVIWAICSLTISAKTAYELAVDGLPLKRTNALGHTFAYAYDKARRLTVLTNENGETYRLDYDQTDNLIQETGWDGKITAYGYDAVGQLVQQTEYGQSNHEGRLKERPETWHIHRFKRNILGQLIEKQSRKVSGRNGQSKDDGISRTRFEYDPVTGNLTKARNQHSSVELAYDELDRLIGETTVHNGQSATVGYRYDPLGNRIRTILPDGRHIDYLYYGSGHLHQISLNGEVVSDIERDKLHREIQRTQGSISSLYDYDPMGRLKSQRTVWSGTPTPRGKQNPLAGGAVNRRYAYDKAGNLIQSADQRSGVLNYVYDKIGRIQEARNSQTGRSETFAFDPAHNILSDKAAEGKGSNISSGNRLKEYNGIEYTYDALGNLIYRQLPNGENQYYQYDLENQLVRAEIKKPAGNTEIWTYAYDPFGRRLSKERQDKLAWTSTDPKRTHFVWDGSRLLQEYTYKGCYTYIYTDQDSYEPLAQVFDNAKDGKQYFAYFHTDQIGIPREMTDIHGNLLWYGEYTAWGRLKKDERIYKDAHQPFRLQNQYFDEETGLHYNFFRYYEPDTGRFINQDPIGLFGGDNLYSFGNQVLDFIDPLGLKIYGHRKNGTFRKKPGPKSKKKSAGKGECIQNKKDGDAREALHKEDLDAQYGADRILSQKHLRNKKGEIVSDPLTGESRKLDFVIKGAGKNGGGHAQEVTSKTASKSSQLAKEERIRGVGGVYVRDGKSLVHVDGISEIIRLP